MAKEFLKARTIVATRQQAKMNGDATAAETGHVSRAVGMRAPVMEKVRGLVVYCYGREAHEFKHMHSADGGKHRGTEVCGTEISPCHLIRVFGSRTVCPLLKPQIYPNKCTNVKDLRPDEDRSSPLQVSSQFIAL